MCLSPPTVRSASAQRPPVAAAKPPPPRRRGGGYPQGTATAALPSLIGGGCLTSPEPPKCRVRSPRSAVSGRRAPSHGQLVFPLMCQPSAEEKGAAERGRAGASI